MPGLMTLLPGNLSKKSSVINELYSFASVMTDYTFLNNLLVFDGALASKARKAYIVHRALYTDTTRLKGLYH